MWPKEHGAYFQLALPLLTALCLDWPSTAAILLTAGAVCAFLGHEPLLVTLGHRGNRVKTELGPRAPASALVLLSAAAGAGGAGLALGGVDVMYAAAPPIVGALVVGVLVGLVKEKTLFGEVIVGAALATALLPVAVASGIALETAVLSAGIWALGFATVTFAVHGVVGTVKADRPLARPLALLSSIVCIALAAAPLASSAAPWPLAALAPSGIVGLAIALLRVHPRHLRRVGWTLAATHTLTLVVLVVALRL